MLSDGTIIALSTPQGNGAIGVIRLSGPQAFKKTALFFKPKGQKSWNKIEPNRSLLGYFKKESDLIDEVLITPFKGPYSYTGEDVIEISCHGSPFILQQIISCFLDQGVKSAKPGEFTLRAYLNKKMDLSQAEAVADLIASESAEAHRIAMQQMRGGFSKGMEELRQQLIQFKALIELELDFSEEEVNFAETTELKFLLNKLQQEIQVLKDSFAYGNVIKKGVPVAIAGKPNVGKSSLLNALFNEEKAIVSPIAGTTRDTIEDTLIIEGIQYRFIDTAGLRQTDDAIESIGVAKAKEKVTQASILLYLYDKSTPALELAKELFSLYHENLVVLLLQNKIDLEPSGYDQEFCAAIGHELDSKIKFNCLGITTKESESLIPLKKELNQSVQSIGNNNGLIVNNSRHFHALTEALVSIENVKKGILNGLPGDLLSIDLKEAIEHVGNITGEIDNNQDILGTIFSQFCIGK
ncbi:tRNA uridine-5-carboxymethylaminomethyl(34) synthesis GTPase MnmE [Flavobacteriaceae bacterium]|nr:tRNA uridine-5-carboxymethylaminomethyl(34) synthesis GTPase MnmE [Flavobacteriaceae bacterium]MDA8947663.1 tRNA uridine-5-carboxymethylaminomethyl(34) synthesis GTPase MnmE [Flavobacteriaceae bacterium]MDA9015899.1 tRNA uridine-5-carboxymethylaminomethyl(34) synthesis GTPase MnmE [Flavobacteriaceae bacterium]MDB3861982.1 tRNA uridine-5-carboxymethylaminomethyl(34) synthesis GTPase MnmE [Flavobacteriaceae bacterium]MDC3354884.1 tRNA uridine-5-carboxymethylaminomethyl(34) synthesis GTPase Mnm